MTIHSLIDSNDILGPRLLIGHNPATDECWRENAGERWTGRGVRQVACVGTEAAGWQAGRLASSIGGD